MNKMASTKKKKTVTSAVRTAKSLMMKTLKSALEQLDHSKQIPQKNTIPSQNALQKLKIPPLKIKIPIIMVWTKRVEAQHLRFQGLQ
jgi:hypothetical protein